MKSEKLKSKETERETLFHQKYVQTIEKHTYWWKGKTWQITCNKHKMSFTSNR